MSEAESRRWYQWHLSTWIVLVVLVLGFGTLMLYPRTVELPQDRQMDAEVYYQGHPYLESGWPFRWCLADHPVPNLLLLSQQVDPPDTPLETGTSWGMLIADLVIITLLSLALALLFEARRRRRRHLLQFSLFDLGLATLVVASSIGGYRYFSRTHRAIVDIEADNGRVSARWYGPTWLGPLRPVHVDAVLLRGSPEPETWRTLAGWSELKTVDLGDFLTPQDLQYLGQLKQLEHLNLPFTDLPPGALAGLNGLSHLQKLRYTNQALTNPDDLRVFGELTGLEELYLDGTSYREGWGQLAALDRLQVLSLRGVPVNDDSLVEISKITSLRQLLLAGTGVTVEGLPQLSKLSQLARLDLSQTPINDEACAVLAGFTQLEELDLSGTWVTAEGIEQLAALQQLRYINLSRTPFVNDRRDELSAFNAYGDSALFWRQLIDAGHRDAVGKMLAATVERPRDVDHLAAAVPLLPQVMSEDEAVKRLNDCFATWQANTPLVVLRTLLDEYGLEHVDIPKLHAAVQADPQSKLGIYVRVMAKQLPKLEEQLRAASATAPPKAP